MIMVLSNYTWCYFCFCFNDRHYSSIDARTLLILIINLNTTNFH